jgi:hypothetical protein
MFDVHIKLLVLVIPAVKYHRYVYGHDYP